MSITRDICQRWKDNDGLCQDECYFKGSGLRTCLERASGIADQDSPVIPEGSEKPDFDPLKPFTRGEWQVIADRHTPKEEPFRFVKGSVVVPGAWLEGEMVGYARCMIDMYYPLLDKSADKQAIDDTLKTINIEVLKRVCYHFAGIVAPGWQMNVDTAFEFAFKEWLKDGKIAPWYSHPSTSKETVKITDLIAAQPSPQAESQEAIFDDLFSRYLTMIHAGYSGYDAVKALRESFTIARKTV
jgi:hypothetical protein